MQTVNGLGMLFHQAGLAFELMTDKPFPEQEVWQAVKLDYPDYVLEK